MNLCVWCFAEHQNIMNMADRDAGLETKKESGQPCDVVTLLLFF